MAQNYKANKLIRFKACRAGSCRKLFVELHRILI